MNFFQNLQFREKIFVVCAAVALALFLLFVIVIDPVLARSGQLDRQLRKAEQDLKAIKDLRREYNRLQGVLGEVDRGLRRGTNVSLVTHLATLSRRTGVDGAISGMTPSPSATSSTASYTEESVNVKMTDVDLERLVKYLYAIERSQQSPKIRRLSIKPRSTDRNKLTVTFRVSVLKAKR